MAKTKCPQHPKYKATHAPRATEKHPQGCQLCLVIYETKHYGERENADKVGGSLFFLDNDSDSDSDSDVGGWF